MTNGFDEMILNMTDTTPEPEDYTGEDGLLYCGKCHKPKEGYFPKETAAWLGRDRHPAECDCQRAEREEREAAEKQRSHLETVERLKRRGFTDPAMQGWGNIGTNYVRGLVALGLQGFLIMVITGIYAILVKSLSLSGGDLHGAIWTCVAYTVLLCFSLFKSGSVAKSILNAH